MAHVPGGLESFQVAERQIGKGGLYFGAGKELAVPPAFRRMPGACTDRMPAQATSEHRPSCLPDGDAQQPVVERGSPCCEGTAGLAHLWGCVCCSEKIVFIIKKKGARGFYVVGLDPLPSACELP